MARPKVRGLRMRRTRTSPPWTSQTASAGTGGHWHRVPVLGRPMNPVRFAVMLLLAAGLAAVVVVLAAVLAGGGGSETFLHLHLDGSEHEHSFVNGIPTSARADHPLENALGQAGLPSTADVPESAEPLANAPGYFESLRISADPVFAPWADYFLAPSLLAISGWTDATGARVSEVIYPTADVAAAQAAFASLQIADQNQIFRMTTAPGNLQMFQRLSDLRIGDQSEGYRYRYESRISQEGVPNFAGEVTTIWARVGAAVFFVNRLQLEGEGRPEAADLEGETIDIQALARGTAARLAAWAQAAGP